MVAPRDVLADRRIDPSHAGQRYDRDGELLGEGFGS
jgi:hypothetical protein